MQCADRKVDFSRAAGRMKSPSLHSIIFRPIIVALPGRPPHPSSSLARNAIEIFLPPSLIMPFSAAILANKASWAGKKDSHSKPEFDRM